MTGNDKQAVALLEAGRETEVMIPKMLKARGYATASAGKWSQIPLQPADWGSARSSPAPPSRRAGIEGSPPSPRGSPARRAHSRAASVAAIRPRIQAAMASASDPWAWGSKACWVSMATASRPASVIVIRTRHRVSSIRIDGSTT